MKKLGVLAVILATISMLSCTSMLTSAAKSVLKPKAGIDASLNGEAKNQIIGQKVEETKKIKTGDNAEITENHSEVVNKTTNIPAWVVVLACLGWVLPGPYEIGRGFIKLIRAFKE